MATTKDIRKRIGAVEKTQKLVSAMKMMSATKLARAQAAIQAARPYADKLALVLGSVASGVDADAHPLLEIREKVRRIDLVVLTSDRLESTFWIFVAFRWLGGLIGPAVLTVLTWYTLKVPNTQSATGILYVAVICVFLGELTSQFLSSRASYPL